MCCIYLERYGKFSSAVLTTYYTQSSLLHISIIVLEHHEMFGTGDTNNTFEAVKSTHKKWHYVLYLFFPNIIKVTYKELNPY